MGKNVYNLYGITNIKLDQEFLSSKVKKPFVKENLLAVYESLFADINDLINKIKPSLHRTIEYRVNNSYSTQEKQLNALSVPVKPIMINNLLIESTITSYEKNTYDFKSNINIKDQSNSLEGIFKKVLKK